MRLALLASSLIAVLAHALPAAAARAERERAPSLWLDVTVERYRDPSHRSQTVVGLAVGTDGGSSQGEFRVGDYAYSIGVRMDPQAGPGRVFEIRVWCVQRRGPAAGAVELKTVNRLPLRIGARAVLARRLHGGETTLVAATLISQE